MLLLSKQAIAEQGHTRKSNPGISFNSEFVFCLEVGSKFRQLGGPHYLHLG